MVLNEVTPNTNNSQAPPAPEIDTNNFQGNSDVVYEDVIQQTPKINYNQKNILTKCPAYEPHQLLCKDHNQRRMAPQDNIENLD